MHIAIQQSAEKSFEQDSGVVGCQNDHVMPHVRLRAQQFGFEPFYQMPYRSIFAFAAKSS